MCTGETQKLGQQVGFDDDGPGTSGVAHGMQEWAPGITHLLQPALRKSESLCKGRGPFRKRKAIALVFIPWD